MHEVVVLCLGVMQTGRERPMSCCCCFFFVELRYKPANDETIGGVGVACGFIENAR